MAMDIYHQVLVKLYDVTEGKERSINLSDLIKTLNLQSNYADILERLNREGWIAETTKTDFVAITQWGIKEAKKSKDNPADEAATKQKIVREANQAAGLAIELGNLLERYAALLGCNDDEAGEIITESRQKFSELQEKMNRLRENLS